MVTLILVAVIVFLVLYIARGDVWKTKIHDWAEKAKAEQEQRLLEAEQQRVRRLNEANFRKHFGAPPPDTEFQRKTLGPHVIRWLITLAEALHELYEVEEKVILPAEAQTGQGAKFWMAISEQLRAFIDQSKNDFYDARNAAKAMGFNVPESYRDYLKGARELYFAVYGPRVQE